MPLQPESRTSFLCWPRLTMTWVHTNAEKRTSRGRRHSDINTLSSICMQPPTRPHAGSTRLGLHRLRGGGRLPWDHCRVGLIVDWRLCERHLSLQYVFFSRKEINLGQRCSDTRGVTFEDVRVPNSNVIGRSWCTEVEEVETLIVALWLWRRRAWAGIQIGNEGDNALRFPPASPLTHSILSGIRSHPPSGGHWRCGSGSSRHGWGVSLRAGAQNHGATDCAAPGGEAMTTCSVQACAYVWFGRSFVDSCDCLLLIWWSCSRSKRSRNCCRYRRRSRSCWPTWPLALRPRACWRTRQLSRSTASVPWVMAWIRPRRWHRAWPIVTNSVYMSARMSVFAAILRPWTVVLRVVLTRCMRRWPKCLPLTTATRYRIRHPSIPSHHPSILSHHPSIPSRHPSHHPSIPSRHPSHHPTPSSLLPLRRPLILSRSVIGRSSPMRCKYLAARASTLRSQRVHVQRVCVVCALTRGVCHAVSGGKVLSGRQNLSGAVTNAWAIVPRGYASLAQLSWVGTIHAYGRRSQVISATAITFAFHRSTRARARSSAWSYRETCSVVGQAAWRRDQTGNADPRKRLLATHSQ